MENSEPFSLALWVLGIGLMVFLTGYVYLKKWAETADA
jgi:hypothetical protein